MSDAGPGEESSSPYEGDIDWEPSMAGFNENLTGEFAGGQGMNPETDSGGIDTGAPDSEGTPTGLTPNEPEPAAPAKTAIKKREKRRSLLGEPSNVYKRSILGS